MLEWVKIRNLALIAAADVEFGPGFNVVTGETGAGKSVLLGTVSLLLGERADKGVIRAGAERCELTAAIAMPGYLPQEFFQLLEDAGIVLPPNDRSLQLKRIITASRNRNFINDTPVTLETLKAVGEFLIDVHGANEHQSLLQPGTQLQLLDRYGRHEELLLRCSACCDALHGLASRRETLFQGMPTPTEAEFLRRTVAEIAQVNPQPEEDAQVAERHRLAAGSRQILEITNQSVNMLTESEDALVNAVAMVYRTLTELGKIDPQGSENFIRQCDQLSENVRDLSNDLEHYAGRVNIDEEELLRLETRLGDLQRLKRRYGPLLENIFTQWEEAETRLRQFDRAAELRRELDQEEAKLRQELEDAARELTAARQRAAGELAERITEKLRNLGFLRSSMNLTLVPLEEAGRRGRERVEFMFSANPGQPLQPLRNIASSGEISRVMLAAKTVLAEADAIPILVFDEIDVNIGGETAVKVGRELRHLAVNRQILCISHLPQVAALGETHYLVSKTVEGETTVTSITPLDNAGRKQEIARMLGGGPAALDHARRMLRENADKGST